MKGLKVSRNGLGVHAQHPLSNGKTIKREPRLRAPHREGKEEHSPLGKGRKRYRPPDVRTIFSDVEEPRLREERGQDHHFIPLVSDNVWCDRCCHFVCGQFLRCTDCRYTCHTHCQELVQLGCQQNGQSIDATSCSANMVHQLSKSEEKVRNIDHSLSQPPPIRGPSPAPSKARLSTSSQDKVHRETIAS